MKDWTYCKTVTNGTPCIGLESKEGCHYCYYHNSPEFCKKTHEQQAAQRVELVAGWYQLRDPEK